MERRFTFGIVGGYGAGGRVVAAELGESTRHEIVIGGRDLTKASALAAQVAGRASAAKIDVFDTRSLDDFCTRCSISINCSGPVIALEDRVAPILSCSWRSCRKPASRLAKSGSSRADGIIPADY